MKNLEMTPIDMLIILIVIAFFGLMAGQADAQTAPVKCKHLTTGQIITITGQSCPRGWMRWY